MKRDWTSRTTILLVGVILIVINLIGLNLFTRVDLTDDQVYSLSEASIQLVENLDDPVTVTAFFTDDLPAPYSTNRRFLRDKLDDYRAYEGENVQYRFVDPNQDESYREEADRYGIPPVQIQVIEQDNVQLKNAYMGVAIQYGVEREIIPVVQDLSSLEYDITSAIRRLTRDELPLVGFLSGHGEPSPMRDMQTLNRSLQHNYEVQTVSVQDSVLSPKPNVLVIVAPTDSLPETHLRTIDRYLVAGGRVAILLNRISANLQIGQASVLDTGLEGLLESYGVRVNPNLVVDEQSSVVTMQRQSGFFNVMQQIPYPFLPIATRFNPENQMVSRLGDVLFYFVSSIDTSYALPEGVVMEPLIQSSPRSSTQEGFFLLQPQMLQQAEYSDGPFVLAAAYRGTFPSAYEAGTKSTPTRLVVVSDGDFVNESILGRVPGNISLGLNMIDWLVQDDALLTIRTRSIEPRALDDVSEAARPWIKYFNMIGPVLFVVLFGLVRWRRRKNRQVTLSTRHEVNEAIPA